jgi:hypothetical protein
LTSPLRRILSLIEGVEFRNDLLARSILIEVQNLLQFVALTCFATVCQKYGCSRGPYLETRVGTLGCNPEDALQQSPPLREVALLMTIIEAELQLYFTQRGLYAPMPLLTGIE